MELINLKHMVKSLNVKVNREIPNDLTINNITTDTRETVTGSLFVALNGKNFDGHKFVDKALKNGAKAILISKDLKNYYDYAIILKTNEINKCLMQIVAYYKNMLKFLTVGITGSVGKTCTKDMIASVLSKKFNVIKTNENFNNEIGVFKTVLRLTKKHEIAVVEMGMCKLGEISELSFGVKPDFGVITKIGVAHMEHLKSKDNIFRAKMEITNGMCKSSQLFLNADDNYLMNVKNSKFNTIFCGINNKNADIRAQNIIQHEMSGSEFDIIDRNEVIRAFIPATGEHNILNSLFAYAVGKANGLLTEQILEGLKQYKPTGARQNIVVKNNITYVKDYYNANTDSVKAAIKTMANLKNFNKKIFIFANMNELGEISENEHKSVGAYATQCEIDFIYCVGEMAKSCFEKALDSGHKNVKWFKSKKDLAVELKTVAEENDIVWMKGSRYMKLEDIAQFLEI